MNDHHKPPKPWDLPVVRGLDAIRRLHGLEALHVGFDDLHLHGEAPHGPMYTAVIHAYQPTTSVPFTVKFAVRGATFTVHDHGLRPLTASGVADLLRVPLNSADRAVTLLKSGLTESLRVYNEAHPPTTPASRRHDPAAGRPEPWPFRTPSATDTPGGPHL